MDTGINDIIRVWSQKEVRKELKKLVESSKYFSVEDKGLLFEELGYDIIPQNKKEDYPQMLTALQNDFWIYVRTHQKGYLEEEISKIDNLPLEEQRKPLSSLLQQFIKKYGSYCKERTRSDCRTNAYLYRHIQRATRNSFPLQSYGGGQWFGAKGLDENLARELCSGNKPFDSTLVKSIPLPPDAPTKKDLFSSETMRLDVMVKMLPYFWEESRKMGQGELAQLRAYAFWLNNHYSIVPGLSSNVSMDCFLTEDEGDTSQSIDIPSEALSPEDQAYCKQVAKICIDQMTDNQKKVCGLWQGNTDAKVAEKCNFPSAAVTRKEKGKISNIVRQHLAEAADLAIFVLSMIFSVCESMIA